ncbi:DUF4190 domain-containing protein [Glutamicibacter protophormiae]|mgnify:FL=1|uniref:MFS family permease n=1 Tax=Glutamicibacter protophormiae TaxID=37930 RepID=A0ABS4XQN0_GLUPR|nr:DUF4190 domain-containing protein [Glutamicibacter protophormiae]MBP2398023.1 MFS family permease [Glutamicibacter protophormiae]QRQ78763.1 DUF4190 domain-containing protein [Glutamicibacter protophormiae]WPR64824.1 DUF4190 domain-containing protein [Glutamicibacter protophormiae]WPR68320.1 DUF4190 domain-containing protein [Glutamicibacter protophormiae]GGL96505.1 hypothetical protein GCM10010038_28460 [Glutamicibacter protophormiae]
MSYYPYPQNPYQRPPESTGLSVASLVLGILSMLGFAIIILVPLAGVITGHLGYRREPNSRALSLAGLITSWIALVLAALLYAFLIWVIFWVPETFYEYSDYVYEDLNYS